MQIHQVKTRLVNSYVVEYDDAILVMDVAAKCHRYVLGFVEQTLQRDIHDIQLVICSHDDPDHIGGVFHLAALCDAKVAIPYAAKKTKTKLFNNPSSLLVRPATMLREAFRPRAWEMYFNPKRNHSARQQPKLCATKRPGQTPMVRAPDFRLKRDCELPLFDDWDVLHTPGHSWDSCCYYHRQSQSLLSGDTLLGSRKKQRLMAPSIYANPLQMRETLQNLQQLDIKTVYPGHGSVLEGAGVLV